MPDTSRPRKGQYAVWRYDQYPYFICAKIVAVHARREHRPDPGESKWAVEAEGYGNYRWVPVIILPPTIGATIAALRDELALRRREKMEIEAEAADDLLVMALEKRGESARIVDHVLPERLRP